MRNPTHSFLPKIWLVALLSVWFVQLPLEAPAQNGESRCALAAPAAIWPKTVTPTTITVQWQAVSNAVAYQVKVVDLTLGQPVTTFITDQTTATVTGLTPGHWYGIVVQASRCAQGPFGDPVGVKLQSSIIIVDVILQRDCPGDENPGLWLSDIKQCTLKMTGSDMYRFTFEDTAQGAMVDFSLAAQPAQLEMETHAEVNCTIHAMDSIVEVLYNAPPPGSPALVRIWIDNSIFPDMVFSLEKAPNATVYEAYCGRNISDAGAGERSNTPEMPVSAIELTPNPARDRLRVRTAGNTLPTADNIRNILVTDIYGRPVCPAQPFNGEGELHIGQLPAGWYVLRLEGESSHQTRMFLKLP